MEADAKAYSALNKPQYDMGCGFVRALKISQGDKVLDMGCGTGEITNFIASLVGPQGEVVGVDPDEARIKIAQEKFKAVKNLHFIVGDSSSRLPHDQQEYYDLHFSSSAFHWCIGNQKKVYLEKAYQCLKPAGRLAFLTSVASKKTPVPAEVAAEVLTEVEYKQLCEIFSFKVVVTERSPFVAHFSSLEEYKVWFKASVYCDLNDMEPDWVKMHMEKSIKIEADGRVKVELDEDIMFTLVAVKTSIMSLE